MAGADWKKICCCVDFSDASRTALEVAADLAKRSGGELTLLHAYPVPGYTFPDGSVVASPTMMQQVAEGAERHLEAWRQDAAGLGPAAVRAVTAVGEPSREIVDHAKANGIELLVLGSHGRSGIIEHALLGSVAERVVRRAPCAVLTVRPR